MVVPTYRRNDSLARCLDQLVEGRQTLPFHMYEVIVSDDGPEGSNARLLVEEKYPWVRWVAGPARGPAANRNRGASQARGGWLVFTDDDCLPQAGWLAAYAARLEDRGQAFPFVPDAMMFHPPRPASGGWKWVRSQESAFYLARKRGVPPSQVGQSVMVHARVWVHTMRLCRNAKEVVGATLWIGAELFLVACHWPFWGMKYRQRKVSPAR